MNGAPLVLGTRGSALALRQARLIQTRLETLGHAVRLREITTTGDRILDVPLPQIGEKALFTKELDLALLDGAIDLAVHSLKDLPTQLPPGLHIAAVASRDDTLDAFVAHPAFTGRLEDLPEGAVLGTSSLRRHAQIKAWRSDLNVVAIRGNVDTRLTRLDSGKLHGLILAAAGLRRLGLDVRIRQVIEPAIMLPAVGQGALAVVCAESDVSTSALLRDVLHDHLIWSCVCAERAFLGRLEGGCSVPVGALGRNGDEGRIELDGCVASLDGSRMLRERMDGAAEDAERIGVDLADELLGRGANEILERIRETQE